jgi:hypothetical protein
VAFIREVAWDAVEPGTAFVEGQVLYAMIEHLEAC